MVPLARFWVLAIHEPADEINVASMPFMKEAQLQSGRLGGGCSRCSTHGCVCGDT
jgi:hypothetical protein